MKNKNSKLAEAPLYTILGSIKNDNVNIRVIPLTKAKEKDSNWSYPSTGGTKHVPVSDLNKVLPESNDKSHYSYRTYCIGSGIQDMIEMIKSFHLGQNVAMVAVAASAPAVVPVAKKETPAITSTAGSTVSGRVFSKKEQEDIDAVNSILSGNKEKFTGIYKRYYPIILQTYSLSLKFDRALAEDLAADLFIKVYNSLDKYTVKYTFNSWITRVAKNFLLDYLRKQKLETVSIDAGISSEKMRNEDAEVVTLNINDEGENPEEIITSKEKRALMASAIESLDSNSREAVKMYYFEDKSYVEIAEEMNIPLGTLKSIIFRAKNNLKSILESNKQSLELVF